MSITDILIAWAVAASVGFGGAFILAWLIRRLPFFQRRWKIREADRVARWILPVIQQLAWQEHESKVEGFHASASHFRQEKLMLMAVLNDIEVQLTGDVRTIFIGEGS